MNEEEKLKRLSEGIRLLIKNDRKYPSKNFLDGFINAQIDTMKEMFKRRQGDSR